MKELTNEQIAELRHGAVKVITPELGKLSRANLVELMAQESNEENPRETLIKAVTDRIEAIDADDAEGDAETESASPAYQAVDYAGPLTIEQAQWRLANIKPVAEAVTK